MTEEGFLIFFWRIICSRLFVKFPNKANLFNTTNLVKILQLTRSSLSTSSIAPTIVNTAILVNIIKLTWSTQHRQLGKGEYPDHKVACRARLEGGWNDDVTARRELKPEKYIFALISMKILFVFVWIFMTNTLPLQILV